MDLQKLIYLEAIYRLNSFTKASEELHVTQPALTKAIKTLEGDLGVELIVREAKSISFTEAGIALVQWAIKIIDDFASARKEMAAFSKSAGMSLHIGISNIVGSWIYGEVYSPFMRQYPQSTVILQEYPWENIVQSVLNKELDMAYTTWEPDFSCPNLELHRLLGSELFAVLPPKHPFISYRQIPFDKLDGQLLSVFSKTSLINRIITSRCQQADIHPQMMSVTNRISSMLNLIDTCDAIGFIVLDRKSPPPFNRNKYILRPFKEPILLNTGFIKRCDAAPNRAMKLFERLAREQLEN